MSPFPRRVHGCADCELLANGRCVFEPEEVAAGSSISAAGQIAGAVSFVCTGIVEVTRVGADRSVLRGPRTLLGLEALEKLPSPVEVRAMTDVRLCAAPLERVEAWLGPPSGARRLFELASRALIERDGEANLRAGPPEVRVARLLLALAPHAERGRDAALSKARAAAVTGLTPQALWRVLHRLAERGLVDSVTGFQIRDLRGLTELVSPPLRRSR
ncbi:MAG: Crp/Fnr family transcriptional regulator [Archangiaceae bacterium]|nr:Crp/Fnr family transcriptional regulator [Archangiaceae bacterium]